MKNITEYIKNIVRKRKDSNSLYDVVFLDLNLGVSKSDGMNVSRILREELKNENTHIVYISGYSDYAYKLFDFDPLMFLKKPIFKEDIEKAVQYPNSARDEKGIIGEGTHSRFVVDRERFMDKLK